MIQSFSEFEIFTGLVATELRYNLNELLTIDRVFTLPFRLIFFIL